MALQATLNLITRSIKCDAGSGVSYSFDVENTSNATITVGIEPLGETKGWVKLAKAEHAELELPPKAVQRVAVNVAVPADSQAKRYSFKLRLYDVRTPTIAAESAAVAIEVAVPAVPSAPPQRQPIAPPSKRNWLPIIIAASVGGVVLIGAIVGVILLVPGGTAVPDLVGKPRAEAETLLAKAGLAPDVSDEATAEQEAGVVIRQTPDAGADAPDDGVVKLVVAVAPPPDPNSCKPGFVWREARPGDVVCVLPETKLRVIADNAAAPSRISPTDRSYGPNTCIGGYVWREAFDGDVVCVTPDIRSQAWADNAEAPNRRVGAQ